MSPPSFLREIVITITYPARLGNHIFVSCAEVGRFAPHCAVKKAPAIFGAFVRQLTERIGADALRFFMLL